MGYVLALIISAVAANQPLNTFNDQFAADVDAGNSCFDRVAGEVGSYGKPSDFSMDYMCNYRIYMEEVPSTSTKWKIKRI
jgi:hypothetical protein